MILIQEKLQSSDLSAEKELKMKKEIYLQKLSAIKKFVNLMDLEREDFQRTLEIPEDLEHFIFIDVEAVIEV